MSHLPILTRLIGSVFITILLLSFQLSCGSEEPTISFESGEFTVSTLQVDDQCLDGGLTPLFMPRGDDEPWEWPHPVELYAFSELPVTYTLPLRDPFHEMTVTATLINDMQQELVAETNPDVELDRDRFGACVAELDGQVDVLLVDADRVEGIANLEMRNPRGDERCPADMPDACNVILSFEATRLSSSESAGAEE